ncbi:MAG: DUF4912 domain-containing protein [Planctomycetaceae bacterium]|nr:DUF4912 domain-containing protein [Planctomycetaceae bacterium]
MMLEELRERSRKELAQMAKAQRIRGWHLLKKEELICQLMQAGTKPRNISKQNGDGSAAILPDSTDKRFRHDLAQNGKQRSVSLRSNGNQVLTPRAEEDVLRLELLDSHWFLFRWSLSSQTLERAEVSLGTEWKTVKPVLRIFKIDLEPSGTPQESLIEEIVISDRFREWYYPVPEPECRFRSKLGLLATSGRFYQLACSNSIDTPTEASRPEINTQEHEQRSDVSIQAHPVDGITPEIDDLKTVSQLIQGRAEPIKRALAACPFKVELELTIKGTSDPLGQLTILGEPVELEASGQFNVAMPFFPGREVIPIVETTDDGRKKQTVVVTIEQNRRELEPQIMGMMTDFDDED